MKKIILFSAALFFFSEIWSQSKSEATIVIVACKAGTLIIDGNTIGQLDAEDASKQILSYGEHYLQLKTSTEKFNLTITVDQNTKGITKIGCDNLEQKLIGTRLINKEISLSGALSGDLEQNVIGLDNGDEIILNCSVLNKKGNFTLIMQEYSTGREIFRRDRVNSIENEKILVTTKGVYFFTLYTDALFGKDARLTIDRIPSPNSSKEFKTTVRKVYDTIPKEVLHTVTRVYSLANLDNPNRTTLTINLPKNTAYWAYWIGVDQEAQEKMRNFISTLSQSGKFLTTNPLILFGMKLIPSLPMLNTPATINYRFTDTKNSILFVNKMAYSYYLFKHADNITTDYSVINNNIGDLVLSMDNQSMTNGRNVEIRVVAFVVNSRLVLEE